MGRTCISPSKMLWPKHRFRLHVCVHCDFDLGLLRDMKMSQGHDTPLGHGQQLCEILIIILIELDSEELWSGYIIW